VGLPTVPYFSEYRQIADSAVQPAVVSVHQESVSSPLTNELICHPEIRRVDGSVHHHFPEQYRILARNAFVSGRTPVKLCWSPVRAQAKTTPTFHSVIMDDVDKCAANIKLVITLRH